MSQLGNSSGSVSTGVVGAPGAAPGSTSSVPSWFGSMDWGQFSGQIASGLGSSLGGSIGAALGGATGNDNLTGVLGMTGSAIGGKVASNLMSGQKAFSGFNTNSLTNIGGSVAGSLVGNMIGGDAGRAAGVALGNAGNIVKGIKSIKATNAAVKAGTMASKAGKLANLGNVANLAGIGASIASEFMPEKSEYSGEKGGLTRGLDSAYDMASTAVSFIPGVGTVIGGAMQVGKLLGQGLNALGGGTDGMTTADAILGSSFMNLTPLGMINGFAGKKAHTIERDDKAFNLVGSSYAGTQGKVDEAVTKSGKKYGLVSSRARNRANDLIDRAKLEQFRVSNIANEAEVNRMMASTLNQEEYNNAQNQLNGGLDYYGIRAGKKGMALTKERIDRAKKTRLNKIKEEVRMEEVAGFKNGGVLDLSWEEKPIEISYKSYELDLSWEEPELVISYKEGGKYQENSDSEDNSQKNVIPEGALHARLHHMDQEGITKKGIPVVTEEKGGLVQHAEIECNEIIFCLAVTKKIEELAKDGSEEAAIEAGKLLVEEILENTDDRTGLLKEIQ